MNIKSFPIKYTTLIANEPEGKWVANILVDFSEISFVIFFLLRVTGKHTQADKLIVCLQTVRGDDLEKMATY